MPRVLTARFMHETNTFSRVKTDMALIRRRDFHLENEIPRFAALAPHSALPSRQRTNTAGPSFIRSRPTRTTQSAVCPVVENNHRATSPGPVNV